LTDARSGPEGTGPAGGGTQSELAIPRFEVNGVAFETELFASHSLFYKKIFRNRSGTILALQHSHSKTMIGLARALNFFKPTPAAPDRCPAKQGVCMRATSRRKLEMGQRVLEFCKHHPDPSPGFQSAVARLQERLARARQLAEQQMDGRAEVKVATGKKRDLRRLMIQAHLDHLQNVAEIASSDEPNILPKFVLPADATSYLAFRAAASSIAAEAESRKELLMKHGLSEDVLNGLKVNLDQFELALEQSAAGRLTRAAATAELITLAEEVVQIVNVMNGMVRIRFVSQPEALSEWEIAKNVVATPRRDEKPETDIRPAA
jgi:hypothetical protein